LAESGTIRTAVTRPIFNVLNNNIVTLKTNGGAYKVDYETLGIELVAGNLIEDIGRIYQLQGYLQDIS
jgi:hypothetical protein